MKKVYVSVDSAAIAVGAREILVALHGVEAALQIFETGSRGMCWLEPMIEVEKEGRRLAFGPLEPQDIDALVVSDFAETHEKCLGDIAEVPFFKDQQRETFQRCGVIEPASLDAYRAHGGFVGWDTAVKYSASEISEVILSSGLRGRGGAAFPAGVKWQTVLKAQAPQKYIVCNADEGDSGTFADRTIMEGDPFLLIEGMMIAGRGVGATKGYIYLRSEYPLARRILEEAIAAARKADLLGETFDIEVFMGAGAYICGEETSLLESLEGRRGQVRAKPPLPALEGLHGMPTLVHNVVTLCAVPAILEKGGDWYKNLGVGRSTGTMPFQLAGNVRFGGLFEAPFGISLRDLIVKYGGGTRSGRPIKAVQVGGPLGAYLREDQLDIPMDYEAFQKIGAGVGHGGIVVFDDTANLAAQAKYAFDFCAIESCGKCTPCRIGAVRGSEVMAKVMKGEDRVANLELVEDLCEVMEDGSLCAMGGMTPVPVMSAIRNFPEDFGVKHTEKGDTA